MFYSLLRSAKRFVVRAVAPCTTEAAHWCRGHTLPLILPPSLSLSLSFTHSFTHTLSLSFTHSFTHSLFHYLSLLFSLFSPSFLSSLCFPLSFSYKRYNLNILFVILVVGVFVVFKLCRRDTFTLSV